MLKPCLSEAQQGNKAFVDPREAEEHFSYENFHAAMKVYKVLLKNEPQNIEYNYKIALCYLLTNINKSLAIPYLEFVTKQKKFNDGAWYYLGQAYHYTNRFDEAIEAYTHFKEKAKGKDLVDVDRQIEMCYNAKELIKYPLNVTFENLGKEINSEFPDYYPLVTADESALIFTARRKENVGGQIEADGYYSSDIYISKSNNGAWGKPKNIGTMINTSFDEQAVGLSSDGKTMLVYLDHIDSLGNIYISENKKSFQRLEKLSENINSDFEISGSISSDKNILFFTSERAGGLGKTDIYMVKKLPNGQWALPQNLGSEINTKYEEDFPYLADDGKTLYFASQGHSSMGGFDVFKSIWDEENNTWSAPRNIGYPVNTTSDDRCISFAGDNSVGYLSALRVGGYGDLDLYKVKFNDVESKRTIFLIHVLGNDSLNTVLKDAEINVEDKNTNELLGAYRPSKSTGYCTMTLPPGKWKITVEADGYKSYTEDIIISDIVGFKPEVNKDIRLTKKK